MKIVHSFLKSFAYAWTGVRDAARSQNNLKIEVAIGGLALVAAGVLGVSLLGQAVLLLTIGAVLSAEMMNTAFEALTDLLSPEKRDAARVAKDVAAGAVLLISIAAALVGFFILGPPLAQLVLGYVRAFEARH